MKNTSLFLSKSLRNALLITLFLGGCSVHIAQAQKVGVNTSTPTATLDVNGTIKTDSLQLTTGATNGYILRSDSTGNATWVNPITIVGGNWTTSGANQFSALSGNVGIGTTSPTEKLHVVGNAIIDAGRLKFANNGESVFIGEKAGENDNFDHNYNVFVGYEAGKSSTTGKANVAIGHESLSNTTESYGNVAIGSNTGYSITTGSYNTALGFYALQKNTTGYGNVSLGGNALYNNISGIENTAIGANAGLHSTGSSNVFIGYNTGFSETGSNKLYIDNSTTTSPLIWGDFANDYLNFNANVGIGTNTPAEKLHVLGNLRIDGGKLQFTNTETSLYIGDSAGNADSFSDGIDQENLAIGKEALNSSTVGYQNIAIGLRSLKSTTIGENNIAIGVDALAAGADISANVAIGHGALMDSNDGFANVAVGGRTLGENTSGSSNTAVGDDAGTSNQTGSDNVYFGSSAGWHNLGSRNTMIGTNAGNHNLGSDNVLIGYSAGENETGSNKLYIDNTSTSSPLIWGDFSNNYLNFNANVGIGTTSPTQAKLVVSGAMTNTLSYAYLSSNASVGLCANCTGTYSIYANSRIAASEFNAFSDRRIKKNFHRTDNAADLATLMQLQITDYQMVDSIAKGNKAYKKVIAQEVAGVYPNAVSTMTDVIPDIYQLAEIKEGFVSLKNSGVKAGERVKLIFSEKEALVEVVEADKDGFRVNQPDFTTLTGSVFVYGREVSDFHSVDYEALTTLNISATQALVRQVEALQQQNEKLNAENKGMKSDIEALKAAVFGNASKN